MEWAGETVIKLRELWAEGHSTAEIGRRLGVTKNAVVGKAHRLDLSDRPSPIIRDGVRTPRLPPAPRAPRATLALLASLDAALPPTRTPAEHRRAVAQPPVPRAYPPPPPPPPKYGRKIECCWPIGEPGTRSFRFCDAESVPGKPYCADHAQVAYVKVRDRR